MTQSPVICWLRQDLRLHDNPALKRAVEEDRPVLLLFIEDNADRGKRPFSPAQSWWLHHSLDRLNQSLRPLGQKLLLRRGSAQRVLNEVVQESGANAVFWNRLYEPWQTDRDSNIKSALKAQGIQVESFSGHLLHEPWTISSKQGQPFKVFTPFWKAIRPLPLPTPLQAPEKLETPEHWPKSLGLEDLKLEGNNPCLRNYWTPGEAAALQRLEDFLSGPVENYHSARDLLGQDCTSRLGPALHWGELSVRQLWAQCQDMQRQHPARDQGIETFMKEVAWREFAQHLLFHWPDLPNKAWKPEFDKMPWRDDPDSFERWCQGQTGFPVVDAAMLQLMQSGWMHNRARMITASFLTKHLMIDWRWGETFFYKHLVDADLANNTAGWQWVAGSGADAAPYFRIFNPVSQGEKFDPDGRYLQQWLVAEAAQNLHQPGPDAMVDLKAGRERALIAYASIRSSKG